MKNRTLWIHLADDEWGNELMREVAAEAFRKDPSLTVVEVIEHGGWWLSFANLGGRLVVLDSANDAAVHRADIRALRQTLLSLQIEYVGTVRRQDLKDATEAVTTGPVS